MNRSDPPAFILGDHLNALGLVRSLGRAGIRCVVFCLSRRDIIYHSRYCETVFLKRDDEEVVLEVLERHAKRVSEHPVLYATNDLDLRFMVSHRERLNKHFRFIAPDLKVIETLVDKALFADFIEQHVFPAPLTVVVSELADVEKAVSKLCFPVIIKPALSPDWRKSDFVDRFGIVKMVYAENEEELRQLLNKFIGTSHALVVQEFIPGKDDQMYHYYSLRNKNGHEVTGMIARRLRILPIHGGVGVFVVAEHNLELAKTSQKVLDALGFTGPSSICFKRHSDTGAYKVYEINGRFPMCHSIFQMCGVDLPLIYYKEALNRETPEQRLTNIGYKWMALEFDIRASIDYWRVGELSLLGYLRSLPGTRMVIEIARDDLRPFFFTLGELWRQIPCVQKMKVVLRQYLPSSLKEFIRKLK